MARLHRANENGEKARQAAIAALQEALTARAEYWSTLAALVGAEGKGTEYQAAVILTARRERQSEQIVARALNVTWFDRMGF